MQKHYYECSGCDEVKDSQEHDFATLDNGICSICNFYLGHNCSMFTGTQYGYDANNHYFKCTYCKENISSTGEIHEFNMDTCTTCGYVDPDFVASSAPAVSKIHDLRVITREFYTLIIFPDGKVALIDPKLDDGTGALSDMCHMLPDNDKDNDGLPEIDYLIFTSPSYVPTDGFAYWNHLEILNIYRPNIGFDPELVVMSEYLSYSYQGEKFTCEDLKNVPEYLTTGVELPYYDDIVTTNSSPLNHEGR